MPLFGAHMSIAGGLSQCPARVPRPTVVNPVQLFTKKPEPVGAAASERRGRPQLFRHTLRQTRLRQPMAHDSYLINLASPDPALYRRSLEAFTVELQRAEQLGLSYLVMHPGALVGPAEEEGLARVIRALDDVHARCAGYGVQVLVETTAGQGTTLGWRFEQLAAILSPWRHRSDSASVSTPATSSRPAIRWRRKRITRRRWRSSTAPLD